MLENLYCFPMTTFIENNNELDEKKLLKQIGNNWQKINSITYKHVLVNSLNIPLVISI